MATLILSMDGLVLKEIALKQGRITIGRKSSNDVQIDNPAISGKHAVITTVFPDSFLEDLDSTNGTQVNGRSVKRYVLKHNDIIEIGKYRLKFLNEIPEPVPVAKQDPLTQSQIAEFVPAPTETLIEAMNTENPYTNINTDLHGFLRVISGPKAGMELPLNRESLTLGKPGVQVARIDHSSQNFRISHVEGMPIIINDKPYGAQASHALHNLDQIEIQGVKMLFLTKL
ncbi:MAG: FHA domain-containing protein [Zoogloeaceae bacterium]|jgi:pSer/pThr/pTyr-binding forkhead associated (FHA) protein|nr:FHA domain-containing protein [Zoogloeaceae bacterium]